MLHAYSFSLGTEIEKKNPTHSPKDKIIKKICYFNDIFPAHTFKAFRGNVKKGDKILIKHLYAKKTTTRGDSGKISRCVLYVLAHPRFLC